MGHRWRGAIRGGRAQHRRVRRADARAAVGLEGARDHDIQVERAVPGLRGHRTDQRPAGSARGGRGVPRVQRRRRRRTLDDVRAVRDALPEARHRTRLRVQPGRAAHPDDIRRGSPDHWEEDPESTRCRGAEPREEVCPAWWYHWADHKRKPKWSECEVLRFADCPLFAEKGKCWERFDREAGEAESAQGAQG